MHTHICIKFQYSKMGFESSIIHRIFKSMLYINISKKDIDKYLLLFLLLFIDHLHLYVVVLAMLSSNTYIQTYLHAILLYTI